MDRTIDQLIDDGSDRELQDAIHRLEVEVQERYYSRLDQVCLDAITHGIQVMECSRSFEYEGFTYTVADYIEWLQGRGNHYPASKAILKQYEEDFAKRDAEEEAELLAQEERKQSMRTTGA